MSNSPHGWSVLIRLVKSPVIRKNWIINYCFVYDESVVGIILLKTLIAKISTTLIRNVGDSKKWLAKNLVHCMARWICKYSSHHTLLDILI